MSLLSRETIQRHGPRGDPALTTLSEGWDASPFSHVDTPEIRAMVGGHVKHATGRILREVDGVLAIYLAGSFGRGEGGVVFSNGHWKPVNDYDFQLICESSVDVERLATLGKDLAKTIGISWVHIDAATREQFPSRITASQYGYDFMHGARLLWGDAKWVIKPQGQAAKIPAIEAERLLHARLWCFVGPVPTPALRPPLEGEDGFLFYQQMSKAMNACMEAVLIAEDAYAHLATDKLDRIRKIPGPLRPWLHLVEWAVEFKLRPRMGLQEDQRGLYLACREAYLATLRWLIPKSHGVYPWIWALRVRHPALTEWAASRRFNVYNLGLSKVAFYHLLSAAHAPSQNVAALAKAREAVRAGGHPEVPLEWGALRRAALSLEADH